MHLKSLSILILSFLFFTLSCDKIDNLTKFDITYNQEVVIPSSSLVSLPFSIFTPEVTTNSASTFESNNTNKDLIEDIRLTELNLNILSPNDGNFNFLKSVEVFISSKNFPEKRIAWKENIEENNSSYLSLETLNEDIQDYIKEDKYTLRVETITDETIKEDHKINIESILFVDAKILGI